MSSCQGSTLLSNGTDNEAVRDDHLERRSGGVALLEMGLAASSSRVSGLRLSLVPTAESLNLVASSIGLQPLFGPSGCTIATAPPDRSLICKGVFDGYSNATVWHEGSLTLFRREWH